MSVGHPRRSGKLAGRHLVKAQGRVLEVEHQRNGRGPIARSTHQGFSYYSESVTDELANEYRACSSPRIFSAPAEQTRRPCPTLEAVKTEAPDFTGCKYYSFTPLCDGSPMPQDHLAGTAYRNGAGITSLVAGIVAALACLVPFIGGAITIAAAVVALVSGWIGLKRVEHGEASNSRDAVVGTSLALGALFVAFVIFAATHSAI